MSERKDTVMTVRISPKTDAVLVRLSRRSGSTKSTTAREAMQRGLRQMEVQFGRIDAENRKAIVNEVMVELEPQVRAMVQTALEKATSEKVAKKKVPKKKTGKKSRRSFGSQKPSP